ncbi:MAG: copper chaperone Copz family protein [Clostridia bacterium]|nr:copper chaperone Copz family protein [Clostridia bacterium]
MSSDANNNCCSGIIELVVIEQNIPKCPVCREAGRLVKNVTVRHIVNKEFLESINNLDFAICMNESCNTVYFSLDEHVIIEKKQVKEPIWYKNDADPKYACYCNKVTFDQVKDAVRSIGNKNMNKVIEYTGAMKNCQCEIYNPLGICCHETIKKAIDEA